jgi:crotonobetainyl-CoA:carnitine CoA-transferase CaiB-like acyl-CoA transferase
MAPAGLPARQSDRKGTLKPSIELAHGDESAGSPSILAGTRVIDFGRFVAGPYCGALLADLGADVIRVERVGGGEDRWVTPVTTDGTGAAYLQCNRGKRAMTLSLTRPEGQKIVERLVASADVVLANLPPDTLRDLGLDYDSVKKIKPDIILTTVTAWGPVGEWSTKVGFDGLAQAASGSMYLTGPEGAPTRAAAPYVDFSTAAIAALGTVAAILHRRETGNGQLVEASLLQTAVAWNAHTMIEQALIRADRRASHNRVQTVGPADVFTTRDGWIMLLVVGNGQFRRWTEMIGRPDLQQDVRFRDDASRGKNGVALSAYMAAWSADRTTDECMASMEAHRLPGGPILSPQELLDLQHAWQAGIFQLTEYPTASAPVPLCVFPARLSATPGQIRSRAPELGEHTVTVLAELGYDQADIENLAASGVI